MGIDERFIPCTSIIVLDLHCMRQGNRPIWFCPVHELRRVTVEFSVERFFGSSGSGFDGDRRFRGRNGSLERKEG